MSSDKMDDMRPAPADRSWLKHVSERESAHEVHDAKADKAATIEQPTAEGQRPPPDRSWLKHVSEKDSAKEVQSAQR